jgi:NTP pyrophosphatase (non-canonical NTP hydrolase)
MCNISEENKKTAKYYGYEAQSNQLIEECAELIQAVNKYRRASTGLGVPVAEDKKAVALDNLVEEIADVEIMLEQIKYLLEIPDEDLQAIKLYKVNRTKERMAVES